MREGGEVRRVGEEVMRKHFPPLLLSKVVVLVPGELLWTGLMHAAPVLKSDYNLCFKCFKCFK